MPTCIEGSLAEGGRVVDDPWITVDSIDGLHASPEDASVLVPLDAWLAYREASPARPGPVGVLLHGVDDPQAIAADVDRLALVAVDFPKFTDGRGYSIGRLLRERYGYRGPLRAVGDVLRDQIFYLLRCGFDAFVMKHPDHVDDALSAYRDFSDAYQTSVDRPQPYFARRDAGATMREGSS